MKTAKLGRMAGAMLLHSEDAFFLIGNLKEPCDFRARGFVAPADEIDACARPSIQLEPLEGTTMPGEPLLLETELGGSELAKIIAERMLIIRNGSVSDRLWRLITGADPMGGGLPTPKNAHATWLVDIPDTIWGIVRDTVLRCS